MTDYAALALKLKPYILPWVAGGTGFGPPAGGSVSAHALSGAQHTGQLAQSQATWAATVASLNAHALNANAHHAQVHGLDSTNHTGTLAWAKVNKTGSDLAHLQARAHSSLTGIGPNDHHNQVHDITGADHSIGGSAWDVVGKTAAGALGLIASLDNVSGGQTVLLRSNAGVVTVKQATASDRLRSPILDTASGNLSIQPAGDLLLSPGGSDVIIDDADVLRSDNFLAGFPLAGFRVGPTAIAGQTGMQAGSGEFDELRARIFVADETRVDRGQEYITKSYGMLSRAFTGPAAVGGTAFLYVENSPHVAGAVFSTNDWVLLRYLDMSSGIVLTSVWGQVSAYNVSGLTGEQRWTFTLRQGTVSLDFAAGAMVVCFGAPGQGYILSDAITATSPFIQIGKWVTNPYTPANRTVLTQVGRLDGVGFSGEYGLAASVSGFGSADSWLKAATGGVAINNADAVWTTGGMEIIKVAPAVGIKVNAQVAAYDSARAYRFVSNTGADVAGVYGSYQAGAGGASYVGIFANDNLTTGAPAGSGYVDIIARRNSINPASVSLRAMTGYASEDASLDVRIDSNGNRIEFSPRLWARVDAGGSASAPTFTIAGDTNTGLYFPGADQLALSAGGVQRLSVNTAAVVAHSVLEATVGARVDITGPFAVSTGWRRIGFFSSAAANRGHARVTLINGGGATNPFVTIIEVFHSWNTAIASLHVWDSAGSRISDVRITSDGTTSYLECYFTVALDSLSCKREVTGWDNSSFTLYGSSVAGGGTVLATARALGGYASSGVLHAPRVYATAAGVASPPFTFDGVTDTGLFGTGSYVGIAKDGNIVLISRTENGDSILNLGIGNTFNRNAYVDLFANGAAPTTPDARLIRAAGANGNLSLANWGTGNVDFWKYGVGVHRWGINNAEVMRIDTNGRLGIGTTTPQSALHVEGFARAEGFYATAEGGGVAGTTGLSNGVNTAISTGIGNVRMVGATTRTNTHWLKFYVGTTIVWVPGYATIT